MLKQIKEIILEQSGGKEGDMLTFGESLMVLLVCMIVIFAVLILIMGLLYLFKFISVLDKSKSNKPEKAIPPRQIQDQEQDEEIVAAITAALLAYQGSDGKTVPAPFIIKNIKRIK